MRVQAGYLRVDLRRYRLSEWLTEPSVWAIAVYRLGRGAKEAGGPLAVILAPVYVVLQLVARIITSIDLPRSADVGPGLRIHHGGPIVVHAGVTIGRSCSLGHGVTIGVREIEGAAPTIGDEVELSAYAQVLGPVSIGAGTKVGALALVIDDLPANVTAAGIPARVLHDRSPERRADLGHPGTGRRRP